MRMSEIFDAKKNMKVYKSIVCPHEQGQRKLKQCGHFSDKNERGHFL